MAYSQANTRSMVTADGVFEMKNLPGSSYQLVIGAVSDNLRDYYTKSMMVGGKEVVDSGFSVNGDVSLDVVVSAKGRRLRAMWWTARGRLLLTA